MESVFFENVAEKNIFCIFSEPTTPTKAKKLVIMSHGFQSNTIGSSRKFRDLSRILIANGFYVFRFDQPNSGNSEGNFLDSSFNEWVQSIVYFAKKYLDQGYQVGLLGSSMGASASLIATSKPDLRDKIPSLVLSVPDPKSDFDAYYDFTKIYEENGQKYQGRFWKEAMDSDFFKCLKDYTGAIYLVYGQTDKYVSEALKARVIREVEEKGQQTKVLVGQGHNQWDYDITQQVHQEEFEFFRKNL